MIKPKIKLGYKGPWDFGRWKLVKDNDDDMLQCPDCGCGIIWHWYEFAVGTKGVSFCPYCGADMNVQLRLEL